MAKLFIETSYGIIPNHLLNDVKISLRAKGLYAFIQAKPNEWKFSAERISLETKNGLHSIKKTLQELEKFGYLERKKYQSHNGFWQIEYHLYSSPKNINSSVGFPPSEFQPQENPSGDIPPLENQPTYKTIVYKTINNNINKSNKELNINSNLNIVTNTREKKFKIPLIGEIRNYCETRSNDIDTEYFHSYYTSNGWMVGKTKMKDWRAAIRTWEKKSKNKPNQNESKSKPLFGRQTAETIASNLSGWQ